MTITELCNEFGIIDLIGITTVETGLINSSISVVDKNHKRYLLQEINHHVFKDVDGMMNNIVAVTDHIRTKTIANGGDVERCTLKLKTSNDGKYYVSFNDDKGNPHYFRMYDYIENASTYDEANETLLYEAGVGFGKFQKDLADFPAETLVESIKDFHNTQSRYTNFLNLIKKMELEKRYTELNEVYYEIQFAKKFGDLYANAIMGPLNSGEIPVRVVHNDTKLNNVMLDNNTHKAVCAIDLDTIMPGSMLFDYGDAIRYCANTGAEDDVNLSNVTMDMNKFKAFTEGYLSQTAESMTDKELDLMSLAPIVLSYELGLRFLTDYLDGNKYFKCDTTRPQHNLERARAQFTLMQDMLQKQNQMQNFINHCYAANISTT